MKPSYNANGKPYIGDAEFAKLKDELTRDTFLADPDYAWITTLFLMATVEHYKALADAVPTTFTSRPIS